MADQINYTVESYRGKPALFANGEPQPHFLYCDPLDVSTGPSAKRIRCLCSCGSPS